jgi:glutamate---cysteine ligase / carboxylate-amine ligase
MTSEPTPTAADLRAAFDAPEPLTVGLEEELMLLDPETLDLLPRAAAVVEPAGDPRFKLEMPASQLELSLPPARSVPEAIAALAAARRDLAAAAAPVGRLAAADPATRRAA